MTLDDYRRIVDDDATALIAAFPQLAVAVPPTSPPVADPSLRYFVGDAPRADVDENFVPSDRFAETAARFRIRCPASDGRGVVIVEGDGDCLEPLARDGDVFCFDPELAAADGDIVLVRLFPPALVHILESWARSPDLSRDRLGTSAIKLVRHFAGHVWLLCNGGALPLDGHALILGTCRRIERDGRAIYQEAACSHY